MVISTLIGVVLAGGVGAFTFMGAAAGWVSVGLSILTKVVLGAALRALTPKPSSGANRGYETTAIGTALDHQIIYGKVRVGGARIYDETTGTNNSYLHRILAVAGHEIESFDKIYINDSYVDYADIDADGNISSVTDPDGTTSTRYNNHVRIKFHLGSPTQSADATLVGESAHWTAAHKLSGIAYMYVRMKFDGDVFPSGIPDFTTEVKGKKVYDPRTSTTVWSDNPALCIRDYLTASYGISEAVANIDDTLVTSAANVSDQTNTDAGTTRYTCNGAFTTNSTPYEMIEALLTSMDGSIWYAQGKWRMKPAYWTTPVLSLDEDDLRSSLTVSTRHSRRNNFNTVKGTFRGSESNWQTTDYPQVTSTAALTADNNQESVADVDLTFTDNSVEARRIARITLERNRQQLTVSASFGLSSLQVQVGDNIRLTNSRFGWTNKEFEVVAWNFGLQDGLDLQIQMTLRETSESVYDEVDDGIVYERDNTTLASPFATAEPQSLSSAATAYVNDDGTTVPSITFSWSVANPNLAELFEFEWKLTTDTNYNSTVLKETSWTLAPAESSKSYDYRVRSISPLGVRSVLKYSTSAAATVDDQTIPNAPSGLSVSGGYAATTVEWIAPTANTDASAIKDLFQYEVYRGTSSNPTTLVGRVAGTTFSDIGLSNSTTYHYRVKALDFTGNKSAFSGNASATTNPELTNGTDGTDGNSIFPIYATSSAGASQSFSPTGKTFVTFYEGLTSPSLPLSGQTFVEYVGSDGTDGTNGDIFKTIYLYDANATLPSAISINNGFTPSTGNAASTGTWTTTVPSISSGQVLWLASMVVKQTAGTGNYAGQSPGWVRIQAQGYNGSDGTDGTNGLPSISTKLTLSNLNLSLLNSYDDWGMTTSSSSTIDGSGGFSSGVSTFSTSVKTVFLYGGANDDFYSKLEAGDFCTFTSSQSGKTGTAVFQIDSISNSGQYYTLRVTVTSVTGVLSSLSATAGVDVFFGWSRATGSDAPRFASRTLYTNPAVVTPADTTPSATITWSSGAISSITSGWSLTPPTQVASASEKVWTSNLLFSDVSPPFSTTSATGSTAIQGTSFSGLVSFTDGDFALDGSTITNIDGGNITTGTVSAEKIDVDGTLTLAGPTSGFIAGRTSTSDFGTDGFYIGRTSSDGTSADGFQLSHTSITDSSHPQLATGTVQAVIHEDTSGLRIYEPVFYQRGNGTGGDTLLTASGTVTLSKGDIHTVTIQGSGGGGAGGGAGSSGFNNSRRRAIAGAAGGSTSIALSGATGFTGTRSYSAAGGAGGAGGITNIYPSTSGEGTIFGLGGAGGAYPTQATSPLAVAYGAGGGGGYGRPDDDHNGYGGFGGEKGDTVTLVYDLSLATTDGTLTVTINDAGGTTAGAFGFGGTGAAGRNGAVAISGILDGYTRLTLSNLLPLPWATNNPRSGTETLGSTNTNSYVQILDGGTGNGRYFYGLRTTGGANGSAGVISGTGTWIKNGEGASATLLQTGDSYGVSAYSSSNIFGFLPAGGSVTARRSSATVSFWEV